MVKEQPFVVNPLSVSIQPCGKKRLILDLLHVNKSLIKQSVEVAIFYFAKDAYMLSFDLKSGYHHIDIAQDHQTFLWFSWRTPDSNITEVFYVFTVLLFGLSAALYVSTKALNPLEYWRIQGLCIAIFLNDGWAIVQDGES